MLAPLRRRIRIESPSNLGDTLCISGGTGGLFLLEITVQLIHLKSLLNFRKFESMFAGTVEDPFCLRAFDLNDAATTAFVVGAIENDFHHTVTVQICYR